MSTKSKLRWYQFTVRSLLALMVIVSLLGSWWAVQVDRFHRQEEAVAALVELGGRVNYYHQHRKSSGEPKYDDGEGPKWLTSLLGKDYFVKVFSVNLSVAQAVDADLEHLEELRGVRTLSLKSPPITDAGFAHVARLTELEELYVVGDKDSVDGVLVARHGRPIGDAALVHLKGLKKLQTLTLNNTDVADAGLTCMEGLDQLGYLVLEGTLVTDAGLAHLTSLHALDSLSLAYTKVTDSGLVHLKGLTNIKILQLHGTAITDAGLENLKAMRGLIWLSLQETRIVGHGLVHLRGASGLGRLLLGYNRNLTDVALLHVGAFSNLQWLGLERTSVTDEGLVHLHSLKELRHLEVWNDAGKVTEAGIDALEKALPNCSINRQSGPMRRPPKRGSLNRDN
jgi:internalin A